jgi:hypothetical protein
MWEVGRRDGPFAGPPSVATLTSVMMLDDPKMKLSKTSVTPFVSPSTILVASLSKTNLSPSRRSMFRESPPTVAKPFGSTLMRRFARRSV